MNETTASASRRSRTQLWLLVALFFTPLALSFLLYYGGDGWRPVGSTNYGDLLEPARALPDAALATPDGTSTAADFLRGKWSFVFVGDGACDMRCRQALTDMRQVRIALNEDSRRVQRVFLYAGSCCDQEYLAAEQSGLIPASIDNAAGQELLNTLPVYDNVPALEAGRIYLVDPLGNVVLSYAADAGAKGLLEDTEKLLKLSHIG